MSRPDHLMPGDILLYLNHGWMGNLISWGQWTGTPGEALEYSHIGLVFDADSSVEMNPPASRKFPLSEVPWDRVHVFRIQAGDVNPFVMTDVVSVFQAAARARLGQRYAFGYIATSLGVGLLARIGLGRVSRWLVTRANPLPGEARDVCSTWAEELVVKAIRATRPDFDLFPNLGDNRARPSDWPLSPFVKKVPVPVTA